MGFNRKTCPALKDLVTNFHLIDPFRSKFPSKIEFTFFRPGVSSSRLDRFYVPKSFADSIDVYHMTSLSDHCAVILELKINLAFVKRPKMGRDTYWKLNSSILSEPEFLPSFKSFWVDILKSQSNYNDIADWWDLMAKPPIKQFCISRALFRPRPSRPWPRASHKRGPPTTLSLNKNT